MADDQHIKTYVGLGVEFHDKDGVECRATCSFCHGDKMYINVAEGFFDCKSCGKSGNKYTYMQALYDDHFSSTTKEHYKSLSELRGGLDPSAFQDAELAYDSTFDEWWIPVRNEKGSVINLRMWNSKSGILRNLGGCSTSLYNLDRMSSKSTKIIICEGEWDCIAMEWFLTKNKIKDVSVVAVPGASTFKEQWTKHFTNKDVTLVYDNDEAGRAGMSRAIKVLLAGIKPKSIKRISWPESTPNKFDIRDYVTRNRDRVERGYKELLSMLEDVSLHDRGETSKTAPKEFSQVVDVFRKHIHMPDDVITGLLLEMAVVFSNNIPGEPLWLMLVGPPGGGKTLLLQAVSDLETTHYESSLGPKTLVSGYKMPDGSDPSLMPKIIGKTLIIKEYTEIMSLTGADQDQLFAVLRGAYDGRVERTYPHGVTRIYPEPGSDKQTCHFSMLAGVTNAIHGDNRAALGERFLKFQLFPDDYDPVMQIKSAIDTTIRQEVPEFVLRESASSFLEYRLKQYEAYPRLPTVPQWIQDQTIGLSQIVSMIRAMVSRKQGELVYRPAPEIGTRLSKQIIKLSQCIAYILGKKEVDMECYKIVQRVGMDTCYGWARDVVQTIAKHPEGIKKDDICKEARMGPSNCSRHLEDLYELGAIDYTTPKTGHKGNPPKIWVLSALMKKLFDLAKIDETLEIFEDLPIIPAEKRAQIRRRGREAFRRQGLTT